MTLVEAYNHARKLELASAIAGYGSDRLVARTLGALACLWAGAFAIKFGWIVA